MGIEYHRVDVEDLRILEDELSTHRAVREVPRGDLGEARRRLGEGGVLKYRMIPGCQRVVNVNRQHLAARSRRGEERRRGGRGKTYPQAILLDKHRALSEETRDGLCPRERRDGVELPV